MSNMTHKANQKTEKNMATAAGTAVGAVAGMGIGATLSPEEAQGSQPNETEAVSQAQGAPAEEKPVGAESVAEPVAVTLDEVEVIAYTAAPDAPGTTIAAEEPVEATFESVEGVVAEAVPDAVADVAAETVEMEATADGVEVIGTVEADMVAEVLAQTDTQAPEAEQRVDAPDPLADIVFPDAMNDLPDYVNDPDVSTFMA